MLKKLLLILILILACIIIFRDNIIKYIVNTKSHDLAGVTLHVDEINTSILSTYAEVKGLKVPNVGKYSSPNLVTINNIKLDADRRSILSETIKIEQISINGTKVLFEGNLNSNNVKDFTNSMPKPTTSSKATSSNSSTSSEKNVEVAKLDITNTSVNVIPTGLFSKIGGQNLRLPDVHLKNIGTDKKMTAEDVSKLILSKFTSMTNSAVAANWSNIQRELQSQINNFKAAATKELTDNINSAKAQATDAVNTEVNKATKELNSTIDATTKNINNQLNGALNKIKF